MIWSQFSIKILGAYFGNYVLDNSNWDKVSHSLREKLTFRTECNTFRDERKKRIVNQILLSIRWYIGQIYTIPKFIKKDI